MGIRVFLVKALAPACPGFGRHVDGECLVLGGRRRYAGSARGTRMSKPAGLLMMQLVCAIPLCGQLPKREIAPVEVILTAQPDEGGRKVWHTENYRIDFDLDLSGDELKRIAQVAETTAWLVKHHPLPIFARSPGRSRISLYSLDEDYTAAGGVAGTAGYYNGWINCVLIRGSAFKPTADGRRRMLPRQDEELVVHELVHLCMRGHFQRMPLWFLEGVAEYFASAHLGAGRFSFVNQDASIRQYIRRRLSPSDPMAPVSPLQDIVGMNHTTWMDYLRRSAAEDRYRPYASALLLTHYYLNGGSQRFEWMRAALTRPPDGKLARIDTTGMETAIIRYWKPKGLTPVFTSTPSISR